MGFRHCTQSHPNKSAHSFIRNRMPKLSNILNDSDEIKIPTNAGDITIQYYPSRVTQKMTSQLRAFGRLARKEDADQGELDQAVGKIFTLLLGLIESWDLEDEIPCGKCELCLAESGECQAKKTVPFPLEADRMDELPAWLIADIAEGLTDPNQSAPRRKKKRS